MSGGQLGFDLVGGYALDPNEGWHGVAGQSELGTADSLPPGPYAVGLTRYLGGDDEEHEGIPYTVTCGDGRAVAGHVPSREIAEAIAAALNANHPI